MKLRKAQFFLTTILPLAQTARARPFEVRLPVPAHRFQFALVVHSLSHVESEQHNESLLRPYARNKRLPVSCGLDCLASRVELRYRRVPHFVPAMRLSRAATSISTDHQSGKAPKN